MVNPKSRLTAFVLRRFVRVPIARLAAVSVLLALAVPAPAEEAAARFDRAPPEIASGFSPKPLVRAERWMAVTAHPLASAAAADILRAGGDAVDAAVAAQLVLGLVEPQSSGLGGGAFALVWRAEERRLTTLDGRETAPAAATPELFLDDDGKPLGRLEAMIGGRSVGAPGTPRLLEALHAKGGKRPWAELFAPAIRLAREGFAVTPRLAAQVAADASRLALSPATRDYFLPGGRPVAAGDLLRNPAYADTLEALRDGGADAFYAGPIADDVVAAARSAARPGALAAEDLKRYRVIEREPVCAPYRVYEVCGMGPPSSGGIAIAQILGMLEPTDLARLGPDSAEAWRRIGDASRLAFADRELYVADPTFAPQPVAGLVARDYLRDRARLLERGRALDAAEPGRPKGSRTLNLAPGRAHDVPATSHLSIVDAQGNVVSMTTTIEAGFGSRLMARGFLLNNELTDFSFIPDRDGRPVANRVEPGKRPRSTMAPTIVFRDGRPTLAVGSPGGSQIVGYVLKTLVAHLDWGLDVAQAAALPNMLNRYGPFELEKGTAAEALASPLRQLGFGIETDDLTSGVHAIAIGPHGLEGGADPRREGVAIGE
ncbi:gamma-glutamyltransferase [Methylopila henanensis]|uniref:Glutathione hydrolase proenzyme n=1 Tax=Methylopila henanensis TaxID=873516 RepID=A0ABW4K9A5_9HYPH